MSDSRSQPFAERDCQVQNNGKIMKRLARELRASRRTNIERMLGSTTHERMCAKGGA